MRAALVAVFLLLTNYIVTAQQTAPVNNLLLGYQEFPTAILSHAADVAGNQYYSGYFRGQLTVNKQVLATGNGLEDVFWVKTNSKGDVLRYKTFGTSYSDNTSVDAMAMGSDNSMLMAAVVIDPVTFGSFSIMPYTAPPGSVSNYAPTQCLVYLDTAGTVTWVRKTNLQNARVYFDHNVFHVFSSIAPNYPAVRVGDSTVIDSLGRTALVHLMFDKGGKLLGAKSLSTRRPGQNISFRKMHFLSDGSLLYSISIGADSSFYINNKLEALPNAFYGNYLLLIKTDTAYGNYKTRVLNPQFHSLGGFNGNFIPLSVGAKDSIYAVFNYESGSTIYTIDGYTQLSQRNMLYVLDTSLTVRRQSLLGSAFAGRYPTNSSKRRIVFKDLLYQNGELYFNGQFSGINEAALNVVPAKDTVVTVLPGVRATVDQNGPSRSFVAKCDIGTGNGALNWIGDHREYETTFISPAFLHSSGQKGLAFAMTADNVWNPWIVDSNLTIVSGTMRKNADMPEMPQTIRYFADGSRIVLGYARGKTAMDSTNNDITCAGSRRDAFLVRIRANNQVAWFKRFYSTLTSSEIRNLQVRNGKAWFLVNYIGTQNDSNFIKVDSQIFPVGVNASLLASIDTAGNLNVINLKNDVLRTAFLRHFDFFKNGDLAVTTYSALLSYGTLPNVYGVHVLRLDPSSGTIAGVQKIYGQMVPSLFTMQVDKNDRMYITMTAPFTPTPFALYLHNGIAIADSLRIDASNASGQQSLLKMEWNRFVWYKRTYSSVVSATGRPGDLQLVNDNPVLTIMISPYNQPLYWDGQIVYNGFSSPGVALLLLDSSGAIKRQKVLLNFMGNSTKAAVNGQLYLSGYIMKAISADTIQLNYSGVIDGAGIVLDSNLVAKRSFRVASPYSESMLDMDIFQDSLVALAYTAQTNPQISLNRLLVNTDDYEEDAYVGTINAHTSVVTAINDPLPAHTALAITPNPVQKDVVQLTAQVTEPLRSSCFIYHSSGQFIKSEMIQLVPGIASYAITLPPVSKGVYYLVVANKRWKTARSFVKL